MSEAFRCDGKYGPANAVSAALEGHAPLLAAETTVLCFGDLRVAFEPSGIRVTTRIATATKKW